MTRVLPPWLLLVLATLFWGLNTVIGRAVVGDIPPVAMSFWRWTIATLVILPFALSTLIRQWAVVRAHWRILVLLGVLGVGVYNTLLYISLNSTSAVNAALLNGFSPAATVFFTWLVVREAISRRTAIGMLISLVGLIVIVTRGDLAVLTGLRFNLGDLLMIPAVVCWSLYTALLRFKPKELDGFAFILLTFLVGLVVVGAAYAYELSTGAGFALTTENLAALAYVGTLPSLVSYIFWNAGVLALGANRGVQFYNLVPVWGTLLAVLLISEAYQFHHFAGMVLILVGVWLATARPAGASRA